MPQNQRISKISSFIGIILLLLVVGFTVFINLFIKEEIEPVKERKEEVYLKSFDSTDLTNFWKLEKLQIDSVTIHHERQRTSMRITKRINNLDDFVVDSTIFDRMSNFAQKGKKEFSKPKRKTEKNIISYGALDFGFFQNQDYETVLEDVKVKSLNTSSTDYITLLQIGNIIQDYQVQSIITHPKLGDFTSISFTDGREIVLIKENAEIVSSEDYKKRIENAEYLNDSTRIILPL